MKRYAILISPKAEAAYFAQTIEVCTAELSRVAGVRPPKLERHGDMSFLELDATPETLPSLLRLSFAQGVFEIANDALRPIPQTAGFALHPDFVWGEKYKGKTNETLTQLLINLALQEMPDRDPATLRLLDPMCGRGTSLLWAMRYGMRAVGIEQDAGQLNEIRRGLKKWTKIHQQKHKLNDGWVQKANKKGVGKYIDFLAADTQLRLITGDTTNAFDLAQRKRFDLIVTDIPYGVQHQGGKDNRSPLTTLTDAAPVWRQCLSSGGAMAIAFNANIPKRADLEAIFRHEGFSVVPTTLQHRMSESILRDILLLRA